jgi:hypothetical protein
MEALVPSETLVTNTNTKCHIPEDRRDNLQIHANIAIIPETQAPKAHYNVFLRHYSESSQNRLQYSRSKEEK